MKNLCGTLMMIWGAMACDSNSVEEPDPIPTFVKEVYLSLTLVPIGGTRSTSDPETETSENIRKIRIVVLNENDEIEATTILTDAYSEYLNALMPVAAGTKKTVYAIANEDMVNSEAPLNSTEEGIDFDNWIIGYSGVKSDIEKCVFTFDASKNIPLTGMTEVDITDIEAGKTLNTTLNLVRVATKFELEIVNNLEENLIVTDVTISSLADKQYLTPHFNRESSEGGVISIEGKKDFYFGDINNPFDTAGGILSWDNWLKSVVEESQETYGVYNIADRRGWIMEYDSPETKHNPKNWSELNNENAIVSSNGSLIFPIHYYAESKYGILDSDSDIISENEESGKKLIHEYAAGHQQSYDMSITLQKGSDEYGNLETRVFSETLYNVRALFRNTHVKVVLTVKSRGESVQPEWHVYTRQWHERVQPVIVM